MTITPSFSRMKNNGLYQGTRWQYRWSVPIYADKMIAWVSEEQPARTDSVVHALLTDDTMVHRYGGNAEYPVPFVGRAFRNLPDGYAPEMDEDDEIVWLP